ncbi:unnamed protein product [Medioppia subpectinata]|uniref:Uncharacterized protein n=1 Tax=Medioppia subpectinata TaxID=1979941 RepID=A0A7R9KQI8_9ACAR|nr:unnamed protein product [Medioppia subpectinata]CAG2107951.1 unnamed protein product [Medioppia subpectinata]
MHIKESRNFTGKVVLTTGSSTGIGEGIVKLFSILGASVVITGRNETQIAKVAQEVQRLSPYKLKPLEVVVDLIKTDELTALFNKTIKTYGKAALQLIQLAVPYLRASNGSIISTSSIASQLPGVDPLAYGASKAALEFATKSLAVHPGYILTDGLKRFINPELLAKAAKLIPLKRIGQPLDVAKAVAFLASTDAQFITGANLVIDGGIVYML